jgi:GAF domain-containing protein
LLAESSRVLFSSLDYQATLEHPAKVTWAREVEQRYPPDMASPRGLPQVCRTGQAELYREITDALLVEAALDAEHLRLLRELGCPSAMTVPLAGRDRTLGTLSFIAAESGRRYGSVELALAEDLAHRAATAIDNARLYEASRAEAWVWVSLW